MKHTGSSSTNTHQPPSPAVSQSVVTRDIFHTAFLVTCGMQIREIAFDNGGHREKAVFTVQGEGIERFEEQYRSGLVTVNLFAFREAVRQVKDAMFAFLRSRGISSGSW